jgi:excisionase family DNA binding protein
MEAGAARRDTKNPLLSLQEVADWLQVSRWTVRRLVDRGELEMVAVGGQLRFQAEAVHALIETNRRRGLHVNRREDDRAVVRRLDAEIAELLSDGRARTAAELSEKAKGGIGCRRADVVACLEGNPHLFLSSAGPDVGRSPKAVCWQLRENENRDSASRTADPVAFNDNAADHDDDGREG